MITTLLSLTLALGSASEGAAPAPMASMEAPRDAYSELYKEYKLARRAYRTAEREARQADRLDEFDMPAPIKSYFERFDSLAQQGNAEALLFCALEVQDLGRSQEETKKYKVAAFERLSTQFVSDPIMEKVISKVGRQGDWLTEKEISTVLGSIAKAGQGDDVRAEASYQLARRLEAQGTAFGVQRAGEIYAFVQKSFPETRAAKRCAERVAGLRLAPGNMAPDFDAVDPDGNAFKLSDYRGKVVVLDFWGFW